MDFFFGGLALGFRMAVQLRGGVIGCSYGLVFDFGTDGHGPDGTLGAATWRVCNSTWRGRCSFPPSVGSVFLQWNPIMTIMSEAEAQRTSRKQKGQHLGVYPFRNPFKARPESDPLPTKSIPDGESDTNLKKRSVQIRVHPCPIPLRCLDEPLVSLRLGGLTTTRVSSCATS